MTQDSPVFTPVIAASDFPDDGKLARKIGGWHVLVAQVDGAFHAFNDRCPHAAAMLSGGRVRRGAVMCPLHGARFDLTNGACLGGAYPALRSFPCRVTDGQIEVAVPDAAPGMEDLPIVPR
ncbi:Rieske (2Fe-2S) protein [Sphingomonas sp. GB1N7]|uniref:Rieske (2Fe-2S) protein n=1 Tax=Parasphingomonas caseinilytica TaxID=3096158 RepID=UPI002FC5BA49